MTHHVLKTTPVPFEAVWTGQKTFEVRLDDRYYQRGDTVTLREFDLGADCLCPHGAARKHLDTCAKYSGRSIDAEIGFTCSSTPSRGSTRGFVGGGYVVLSLLGLVKHDDRRPAASPSVVADLVRVRQETRR